MQPYFGYHKNIAITRDSTILVDGAGSQLQRQYSTYALSRFLNIAYIHSCLMHIFYEGLSALEKNQSDPTLLSRYNKTFDIPSDIVLPKNTQIHSVDQLDYHTFFQIKKEAKENGGFHIIRAAFPYLICDQYPEMLS